MILHKKFPCKVLEIATYFCATISLKKYQRLQFYHLHVPVLDETPYIVTKCTVEALEKTQKFLKSNMVEADDSHSCL